MDIIWLLKKFKFWVKSIPWRTKFKDMIIVLKYGGEVLASDDEFKNIARNVAFLLKRGIIIVLVHGGGPQLDSKLEEEGISFEKKEGMRMYTIKIRNIAQEVFGEITNKIIGALARKKVASQWILSEDIKVKRVKELGFVGKVTSIGKNLPLALLKGFVAIPSLFGKDENGVLCNVNADDIAVAIAEELEASRLIILASVHGVLDENGNLISHLDLKTARELIDRGVIQGGMIPKALHCLQSQKVEKIHIIDGRKPDSLLKELFSKKGTGTEIVREERESD